MYRDSQLGSNQVLYLECLKVDGGFFFRHSPRQEVDSWDSRRHPSQHGLRRPVGNFFWCGRRSIQTYAKHVLRYHSMQLPKDNSLHALLQRLCGCCCFEVCAQSTMLVQQLWVFTHSRAFCTQAMCAVKPSAQLVVLSRQGLPELLQDYWLS